MKVEFLSWVLAQLRARLIEPLAMPPDLVLVRHGESEGNEANKASYKGDNSHFTPEFRLRHSSQFRLSPKGRQQALLAGQWIRNEFCQEHGFDRYITSEYVRAMETAGLLGLPNANWLRDFNLRERDWGEIDVMPPNERKELYSEQMAKRAAELFFWKGFSGESMADLCSPRIHTILGTLARECSNKRVIIVCHGEVMWGFRIMLERIPKESYLELDASKHPHNSIHNCQVLHYTRRNPETGELMPYPGWVRSVCPWDMELSSNGWQKIVRPKFTNEQLLAVVNAYPSLIERSQE